MTMLKKIALGAALAVGASLSSQAANAQIAVQPSPNGEVAIVVNFDVKPGAEADFERVFHRSVTCSRLEPGNITFNVHKDLGSERSYILYEIWRSEDALKSHFARPYTVALFAMFDRNLVTPQRLHFVQDLDPQPRSAPTTTNPASLAECR